MSILDTVMSSQTAEALRNFDPHGQVMRYLQKLPDRERQILEARYGLLETEPATLENIGKKMGLTRERVRQIEKAVLRRLQSEALSPDLKQGADLIYQILEEHGNVMREDRLLVALLSPEDSASERARNAIIFILHLARGFNFLSDTDTQHRGWYLGGFDRDVFERVVAAAKEALAESRVPIPAKDFFAKIRGKLGEDLRGLSEAAMESLLSISRIMDKNPFGQWGLLEWPSIRPHDVGDKAYLTLLHGGKPAHYGEITEAINKNSFDQRVAHKETVHNELIRDKRFVLVGRGIYALAEWGFRPGVVADVIADVLQKAARPLSRDEIITEVGKQRQVKRNTIIVGLSNRKRFQKTPDNKYLNADA